MSEVLVNALELLGNCREEDIIDEISSIEDSKRIANLWKNPFVSNTVKAYLLNNQLSSLLKEGIDLSSVRSIHIEDSTKVSLLALGYIPYGSLYDCWCSTNNKSVRELCERIQREKNNEDYWQTVLNLPEGMTTAEAYDLSYL